MKIIYLPSARSGLRWFHEYYTSVFPEGKKNADRHFLVMKTVLIASPEAGRPLQGTNSRIYGMPRTPFSIIYRVSSDRVEVIDVYDQRSGRPPFIL